MGRWSVGARVGSTFLTWCVLAGFVGLWGWQLGTARGPVPGGCGCFDPLAIPLVLGWGFLGALVGVLLVSAVMAAVGLLLYARSRPGRRLAEGAPDESAPRLDVDAWLSGAAEPEAHRSQ